MFRTEIHIKGKLDSSWSGWFDEMNIRPGEPDETILRGALPDKSAVYGVISRLGSLGITLISITCQEENNER